MSGWLDNHDRRTVNGRRSEILRQCLEKGTLPRGLFRLTVPTGGGKTYLPGLALRHGADGYPGGYLREELLKQTLKQMAFL